jgi:hypothetical protein
MLASLDLLKKLFVLQFPRNRKNLIFIFTSFSPDLLSYNSTFALHLLLKYCLMAKIIPCSVMFLIQILSFIYEMSTF